MQKILLCAAAVAAVLALLILVPTSPAALVDMPLEICRIPTGGVDEYGDPATLMVTWYGALLALGAALALGMMALRARRGIGADRAVAMGLVSGACALVCSHLLYCAVRWDYIVNDLDGTLAFLYQFWKGGYTMYGAILGGLAGVALCARWMKQPLAEMMDLAVPSMMVVLLLGRAAECTTLQGIGSGVANEAMAMMPFVRVNEWDEPQLLVYVYEALAALAALVWSLALSARKAPSGRAAETALALVSVCQVLCDSWRGDELIRFGFVRLNMIMAGVVLAVILASRVIREVKQRGWTAWSVARIVLLLASAGLVIALEFALDKSDINNTLLYGVMAAALVAMGVSVMYRDGRGVAERNV